MRSHVHTDGQSTGFADTTDNAWQLLYELDFSIMTEKYIDIVYYTAMTVCIIRLLGIWRPVSAI
jgi:hypothetical protein